MENRGPYEGGDQFLNPNTTAGNAGNASAGAPMNSPSHTAFFGDADYVFALTPDMILELERKTGVGIGGLCRRLFAGDFRHAEIIETIRLALIGGGIDPKAASALITTYAAHQPLANVFPLAVRILEVAYFGETEQPVPDEGEDGKAGGKPAPNVKIKRTKAGQ